MEDTFFKPRQVTDPNDILDEKSNIFIRTLFLGTQAIAHNVKCHDKSSNTDGFIELIDSQNGLDGKITIQAKTYKTKYRGKNKAEIPGYFVAYAERMLNEVCIFFSVDADAKRLYWKYITEDFIRDYKKKGNCASHIYSFCQDEIVSRNNVESTIDRWKQIFQEKKARFAQAIKEAEEVISENLTAFYLINNNFHHLKDSFIERKEIGQLYNWVIKDLTENESNVKLLVGNAGMGKSVVVKQVVHRLEADGIKCFAIKADRFQMLGLSSNEQLEVLINTFSSLIQEKKAVLIIDQIDALSQYITKDRKKLENVISLIKLFSSNNSLRNVRIIVSCRSFDLEFDPKLSELENEAQIKLGALSNEEVEGVVNKLQKGLYKQLDKKTATILQTPQHLNVFCKVFAGNKKKNKAFTSISELYDELWRQSIDMAEVSINKRLAEEILYNLAQKIYQDETLTPQWDYDTNSFKEANYLISQGLIEQVDNRASFFHQSMYDYVFARLYTKENRQFINELLSDEKHQGLFIRSTVNVVLDYERAKNIKQYKDDIHAILFSAKIRPHIQLMFLWGLANRGDILPFERKSIKDLYANNKILFYAFIRRTRNKEWLNVITPIVIDDISDMKVGDSVYEKVYGFLWNHVQNSPKEVYGIVDKIKDEETRKTVVRYILHVTSDYSLEIVTKWYKVLCNTHFEKADFLVRAQMSNVKFVLSNIPELLDYALLPKEERNKNSNGVIEGFLEDICTSLKKDHSDEFYPILRDRIIKAINEYRVRSYMGDIDYDKVFPLYGSRHDLAHDLHEWFVELLMDKVKTCPNAAIEDVKMLMDQKNDTCYEFAFRAMMCSPTLFSEALISILKDNRLLDELLGFSDVAYYYLEVLRKWFPQIDSNTLTMCQNLIYEFKSDSTQVCDKDRSYNGLLFPYVGYNLRKLIWSIPENLRNKQIKRRYQELNRRFGYEWQNEKPNHDITAASICGGLMSSDTYKTVPHENWLKSFYGVKSYANGKHRFFDERVHADAFIQCVSERPEYFAPFVFKLFEDKNVSALYKLSGLTGLIIANSPLNQLLPLLWKCLDMYEEIHKEGYSYKLFELLDLITAIEGKHIDQILVYLKTIILSEYHTKYNADIENSFNNDTVFNDMLNIGINSMQGYAIQSLTKAGKLSRIKKEVYQLFIDYSDNLSLEQQLTAMYYLQKECYDNNLYNEVMFRYATKPISDYLFLNANIMHWFWCNSPESVLPYFRMIINNKRAQPILVQIMFFGMKYEKAKDLSKEMFDKILSQNEEETIIKIIPLAYEHLSDETYGEMSEHFLRKFAIDKRKEIRSVFLSWCDHMPEAKINIFIEMLKIWVDDSIESGMHDIIKYLEKCCNTYPYECYQCIKILIGSKNVDTHFNEEVLFEILLKCYRLFMDDEDVEKADNVLDTIDSLMLSPSIGKMTEIINRIDHN